MFKKILKRSFTEAPLKKKPYSVLYFGSEEFARATLESLLNQSYIGELLKRIAAIVPHKSGNIGPASSLHKLLETRKIERLMFQKDLNLIEKFIIDESKGEVPFDIGIIGSFGRKIPGSIVNLFPHKMLVAHPSLLPKFRGPCPIQNAVLKGETKTGCTLIDISNETIDGGRILLQRECEIEKNDNYFTIANKCGSLAGECLAEILDSLEEHKKKSILQDESLASYAPMIKKTFSMFYWDEITVKEAVLKQRALFHSPSPPHSSMLIGGQWKSVFFEKLEENTSISHTASPGSIFYSSTDKRKLNIRCIDGWVFTRSIKMEGTGFMSIKAFVSNILKNSFSDIKLAVNKSQFIWKKIYALFHFIQLQKNSFNRINCA